MRVSSHLKREQKSRLKLGKGLEYKKLFNETTKLCRKAISIKPIGFELLCRFRKKLQSAMELSNSIVC